MTLRENNLKEIEGGHILDSQGILVGSRRALRERPGLLEVRAAGLPTLSAGCLSEVCRGRAALTTTYGVRRASLPDGFRHGLIQVVLD